MPEFIFTRARLLSKAVTAICDDKLRPFGISSPQFALLIAICRREPITRAEIARLQHLNRSTLTRDLKAVLSEGWIEEVRDGANGRSRPVALTGAGKELMLIAQPAWLTAQAEAEALLGKDGMIAVISITDRIMDHPASKASVSNAGARAKPVGPDGLSYQAKRAASLIGPEAKSGRALRWSAYRARPEMTDVLPKRRF